MHSKKNAKLIVVSTNRKILSIVPKRAVAEKDKIKFMLYINRYTLRSLNNFNFFENNFNNIICNI